MSAFDLLAASIGLAASALAAALLLPLWRRAPVPAYRLAVSVLAAALALPLLQWGARALELPVPHPVRDLVLALDAIASRPEPAQLVQVPAAANEGADALDKAAPAAARSAPTGTTAGLAAVPPAQATPLWTTIVMNLWAAGALWALARTLRRSSAARGLFVRARPIQDVARLAVWDSVRAGSRVGARTRLCESSEVRTPACAGLWRPAVVLPTDDSLAGRPELLACVLTHELVHLERRDPWVLLGEELLRAAFWFHPAAWWLVAHLSALRELSCDCLVVRRTGKRKRYASALVEYATWMQAPAPRASWAAVVPWSESRGHLTRRIEMLLQHETNPKSGRIVAPAAVGVLMTFLWSGQLALATSSCAGTRGAHEHEHSHVRAAESTCEGAACEAAVATQDGKLRKRVAVEMIGSHAPIVLSAAGVAQPEGQETVERHVVVLKGGGAQTKVLQGEEAKAWIEEHAVHLGDLEPRSKHELIEEIRGAWRHAEGEPVEVIVVGPDGEKRVRGTKLRKSHGAAGEGESRSAAGTWLYHSTKPDGQAVEGWVVPHDFGKFAVEFGEGHGKAFEKVRGESLGGAHGGPHALKVTPRFGATVERSRAGGEDMEALRRELEETRAALEEQRRMLEELRLQLQKQREKADSVGAR